MTDEEKTLLGVISIAQTLVRAAADGGDITAALVAEKVRLAASILGEQKAKTIDVEAATTELIRRFSRWIGKDAILEDGRGHVRWLDAARKKDWRYWARYQAYQEKRLPPKVVEALDVSTDEIIGLLEDPLRAGAWDRRGLVVGHVQSGKTGNYTGLVCKAADAGYKVIIVLAGLHNNLRAQTQIRLEEGFLGYETSPNRDPGKPIGVAEEDSDPKIHPHCATTREDKGDFSVAVAKHFFAISPEERPWLFVVKKQKTVLTQLLKWIRGHVADSTDPVTGRRIVSNLPLLVIDDEADHASVDTGEQLFDEDGKPDVEHEPKAINGLIRRILHSFSKKAYVGYTATPFANIFIHRRSATTEEGLDLFPQSFIINLAAPSNYVGPAKVFGVQTQDGRTAGLPLTRPIVDHASADGKAGWMPPKHAKEHVPLHDGTEEVPPSLRKAILSFVLACAARSCRGQGDKHCSMLVHVTRLTAVQGHVHRQVESEVRRLRQRISRRVGDEEILETMRRIWEDDFVPTSEAVLRVLDEPPSPSIPDWESIAPLLSDVLEDIQVKQINGSAKDALDYSDHEGKGLKVIAIGGEKLARGLTLEGLCTSYFVRTTKMYDTLMQMGRWFGYRPGYVDLCRLYTVSELVDWFEHIADASEELREEFNAMVESGATPETYGLRVKSHSTLLVTSPLKMRTAKSLQLSFSGELLETVTFHKNETFLNANLKAADKLVASMGAPSEGRVISRTRDGKVQEWIGSLWSGRPSDDIADFFEAYATHPQSPKVISATIAQFIRAMAKNGELTSWTVAIIGGGKGHDHTFSSGVEVEGMIQRTWEVKDGNRYSIGRLMSPRDEAIDLDDSAWRAALDVTRKAWRPDPARQKDSSQPSEPDVPSGKAIRIIRGRGYPGGTAAPKRGVLLLYLVDPQAASKEVDPSAPTTPVVGFGVSFPSSDLGVKVEYKVDHLLWEQEYGPAD